MKAVGGFWLLVTVCLCQRAAGDEAKVLFAGERPRNNLVSDLLEVASIAGGRSSFSFTRRGDGWIFISAACTGSGKVAVHLDDPVEVGSSEDGSGRGGSGRDNAIIEPRRRTAERPRASASSNAGSTACASTATRPSASSVLWSGPSPSSFIAGWASIRPSKRSAITTWPFSRGTSCPTSPR